MTFRPWLFMLGAAAVQIPALPSSAAETPTTPAVPQSTVRERAEKLASDLIARMTVEEKIGQLVNSAPAIPRLGIPAYNWWTESLHGAIGPLPTTNFPEPIGLAATFDQPLIQKVGDAVSVEVRALHTLGRSTGKIGAMGTGLDTWSPNINIFRDPRWGRGQETFGEDPYLTARTAVAFISGLQGSDPDLPNIIATPKHFAVHSGPESTRHSANVFVSGHDLEDTYLPAFRAAIVEARAGSIMCAYNRIDGQPACSSDLLLKDYLRGAWGFTGYVVSDCDAVRDVSETHHYAPDQPSAIASSFRAGTDNECHGATVMKTGDLTIRYREAVKQGLLTERDIDRSLTRLFSARYRNGDLPGLRTISPVPVSALSSPAHAALAVEAAEKSMVLLKNDGVLPLKAGARVAVIGPLGAATRVLRGNYSSVQSLPPVSVLEGLGKALGPDQVTLVPFGASITDGSSVPESALRTKDGKPGLTASYYNAVTAPALPFDPDRYNQQLKQISYKSKPALTLRERDVTDRSLLHPEVDEFHKIVWTGLLVPPETGRYRLGLSGTVGTLTFDGKEIVTAGDIAYGSLPRLTTVSLEKGRRYPIRIIAAPHGFQSTGLAWTRISSNPDADLARAAENADVLIAVVGLTSDLEAEETGAKVEGFEGGDKTSLDLLPAQQKLLEQAKATGKKLIVVALNGSPINLSWAKDHASAILEAWYPGQSSGTAIANILTGKTNPAGRLPLTFYRSVSDLPPFGDYGMAGRTYRYFAGTPVYPFGYGLSYTRFDYGPLTLSPDPAGAEKGLRVQTLLSNSGSRDGEEVSQLYLTFPDTPGVPRIALRGYQRIALKAGEQRNISFTLSSRDLSGVTADGIRYVLAGRYKVSVGSGQPGTSVPTQSAGFDIAHALPLPK